MNLVEYKKFSEDDFFTARRNNVFYAGIVSDQTIEQTLMRSMSVEGDHFKRGPTENLICERMKAF